MSSKYNILVSIPGTAEKVYDNQFIKELMSDLNVSGVSTTFQSSLSECGCLNKEWLSFNCVIDINFDWPSFKPFDGKMRGKKTMNDYYKDLFHYGKLIIMIK